MSVKEQMGYALVCDFPGCGLETGDLGEYGFWESLADAIDEWREADGISDEAGTFCSKHTIWVEVGDDGDEERVGMPYTIENLFRLADRRVSEVIDREARFALMRHGDRCRAAEGRQAQRRHSLERAWMRAGGIRRELTERLAVTP